MPDTIEHFRKDGDMIRVPLGIVGHMPSKTERDLKFERFEHPKPSMTLRP
jgi:hypothetical protein